MGIFVLMSPLLYNCTVYFHRKDCHIWSTRWTMRFTNETVVPCFLLASYFRIQSHASFNEQHPSPTSKISIFFPDRVCFYDTSKKCQKTSQTLMAACVLTTLWGTGMQSAFSIVCSIKTQCLLCFRWSFWWQVQGGAFLHSAVAAFFTSAHFSAGKDITELTDFPHVFTITNIAFTVNERSAVKNSVHKQEIHFEDLKKPWNMTYSFPNVNSY